MGLLEIENIENIIKGLTPEQLDIAIKVIPSEYIIKEYHRRNNLNILILNKFIETWNELRVDSILVDGLNASLIDKENIIKELRRTLNNVKL